MNYLDVLEQAREDCREGRFEEAESRSWLAYRLALEASGTQDAASVLMAAGLAFDSAGNRNMGSLFYGEAEKLLGDSSDTEMHAASAFSLAKSLAHQGRVVEAADAFATAAISYELCAQVKRKQGKIDASTDDLLMALIAWKERFFLSK